MTLMKSDEKIGAYIEGNDFLKKVQDYKTLFGKKRWNKIYSLVADEEEDLNCINVYESCITFVKNFNGLTYPFPVVNSVLELHQWHKVRQWGKGGHS